MTTKLYQARLNGALLQTGSVGSTQITDATVAAVDVDLAARLEMIAAANPIMNGGFDIWQRGATFTSIATSTYGPDRYAYFKSGTVVHDLLRSTDVPAIAALVPGANYSSHLDVTTADASIAAGDFCLFGHRIEGYNWLPFSQKQFTVGFWVKDTKTGVHCLAAQSQTGDRSCVIEYTVNSTDTWEYKTCTFPASPSAGTWDYTNGIGLSLYWALSCGSSLQTPAGSWASSNYYGSANQVNATDSAANNFKLWGVTMGLGATVAPFWPRSFGREMDLCRRYFERFGGATSSAFATGNAGGTSVGYFTLPHYRKRVAPTFTFSAAGTFDIQYQTTNTAGTSIAAGVVGADHSRIDVGCAAVLTTGDAVRLIGLSSTAIIDISAEL